MLYVLDTSALVDAWAKWYAPETMPLFWDKLAQLASDGLLTIPDAVLLELKAQDDELFRWCNSRAEFLCSPSTEEVQALVRGVANDYPNLRRAGAPSKNFADPVVVAMAELFECAVVTHENATGNINGPRIPDVCRDKKLRVIQVHHLVKEQGWKFR